MTHLLMMLACSYDVIVVDVVDRVIIDCYCAVRWIGQIYACFTQQRTLHINRHRPAKFVRQIYLTVRISGVSPDFGTELNVLICSTIKCTTENLTYNQLKSTSNRHLATLLRHVAASAAVADKKTDLHLLIRRQRTTACHSDLHLLTRSSAFTPPPRPASSALGRESGARHKSTLNRCRRSACQDLLTNSSTTTNHCRNVVGWRPNWQGWTSLP